jgi:UDP-N-acetylmuramate dehydrogenase
MRELYDVPLATLTTLRLGGPAKRLVEASTTAEIAELVADCDRRGEPSLVLGGGSNLVVADAGFDGTVVRVLTRGIQVSADRCATATATATATVTVAAGEPWDDLVRRAVAEGWVGVECLAGIPGLVGATPIQNVGAYGQEVADSIAQVRAWDRERAEWRTFANADCAFTYRNSRFKSDQRYVVSEVTFQLRLGELGAPIRYGALASALAVPLGARPPLADVRAAVLSLRRAKGMVLDGADHDTWSAGSFFTNPVLTAEHAQRLPDAAPRWPQPDGSVKVSAAWLIEQSGFGKGYGAAAVRLSSKHTLALTNRGGASTEELLRLAREVRAGVRERFGVDLVNEPVLVGATL